MSIRGLIMILVLGLPAAALLAFGPRGQVDVPAGRTVIRYWEKWSGVEQREVEKVVDRFNATVGAERGIWVDYNPISSIEQRLLIATAGGDPPDVAGMFDFLVPQYADQDALLPLDELVREFGVDLASFNPIWLEIGRYEDTLYALPSTPYTIALYYNRALFRDAGIDPNQPPATTAELLDYAIRLTKKSPDGAITQLGFTVSPAMLGWWPWIWPQFFDVRLWDGENFNLDTEASRAAYQWIDAYRQAVGIRAASAFEASAGAIEGAQNPFLSGRLAMVFQGPWVAKWITTYTPDLDYGVAPFPSVSAERQNNFASADVFVIPRGARHPREAMTFLAFMMEQENMEALCKSHGKVSPFRTPRPEFYRHHPNPHIDVFNRMAESEYAFGYPQMPTWAQTVTRMLVLLESVQRGDDIDAAIRETQRRVDAIVEEYETMASQRRGG